VIGIVLTVFTPFAILALWVLNSGVVELEIGVGRSLVGHPNFLNFFASLTIFAMWVLNRGIV